MNCTLRISGIICILLAVGQPLYGQSPTAFQPHIAEEKNIHGVIVADSGISCLDPFPAVPSSVPGKYCGGELATVGRAIDINAACKSLYGASATADTQTGDAYGWVCKVPGQSDKDLDMHRVCRSEYGSKSIAVLVGIGVSDWRCLTPADVSGHLVPVLLLPVEKMNSSNAAWVKASLKSLEQLTAGVRQFYAERSSALVRGTNAFVVLTNTTARDWQCLALTTDAVYPQCNYSLQFNHVDRDGLLRRVKQELGAQRWNVLAENSGIRIGGFPTLGPSPAQPATWCGAEAEQGGSYFTQAPSDSYATCAASANNPPAYENAFYSTGHEFGPTMRLIHTDQYSFNDLLPKPVNYKDSIMYQGKGTDSLFFSFELCRDLPFLKNWH